MNDYPSCELCENEDGLFTCEVCLVYIGDFCCVPCDNCQFDICYDCIDGFVCHDCKKELEDEKNLMKVK